MSENATASPKQHTIASMPRSRFIAQAGMIGAAYTAATLITLFFLQGLAWGPVQFRVSEALCVTAVLTPAAIPGLTVGCILSNLIALTLNGTGALGLFDVVGGSIATLIGAIWCWKLRSRTLVALLGPVVSNALIVSAYLPLLLMALGLDVIPFTDISLHNSYLVLYLVSAAFTGLGEAAVIYLLGYPLLVALRRVLN